MFIYICKLAEKSISKWRCTACPKVYEPARKFPEVV